MVQPLKLATPAVVVDVHPERVPPEPSASPKVMTLTSAVTVLPPASSMVTTACVPKASPATASLGSVVKTTWLATPISTMNGSLVSVKPVGPVRSR